MKKTYIIQQIHESQRYWNRELQDWCRDRQEATVYTESERAKSLVLQVRGEQGFLPASGCWVLVSEPNEAKLRSAMAADTEIFTYKCPCGEILKVKVSEGDFSEQESTALENANWRFRGGRYYCSECADAVPDLIDDSFMRADQKVSCF